MIGKLRNIQYQEITRTVAEALVNNYCDEPLPEIEDVKSLILETLYEGKSPRRIHDREKINNDTSSPNLRTPQAAKLLGMGVSTFYKYASKPGFPAPIRLSKRLILYKRDELINWYDAQAGEE